jgi:hypothetical protein
MLNNDNDSLIAHKVKQVWGRLSGLIQTLSSAVWQGQSPRRGLPITVANKAISQTAVLRSGKLKFHSFSSLKIGLNAFCIAPREIEVGKDLLGWRARMKDFQIV